MKKIGNLGLKIEKIEKICTFMSFKVLLFSCYKLPRSLITDCQKFKKMWRIIAPHFPKIYCLEGYIQITFVSTLSCTVIHGALINLNGLTLETISIAETSDQDTDAARDQYDHEQQLTKHSHASTKIIAFLR